MIRQAEIRAADVRRRVDTIAVRRQIRQADGRPPLLATGA